MSSTSPRLHVPRGYTLAELIASVSILGILCAISIPAFSSWLPEYRLKSAVRDLYSSMQLAKILSVKECNRYMIVFNAQNGGSYRIIRPDGSTERAIDLYSYDPSGRIKFGGGKATKGAKTSGGTIPDDGISYAYNRISFNPTGMANGMGYVYLDNDKGDAYAVGSWITGVIVLKKWNEVDGEWE